MTSFKFKIKRLFPGIFSLLSVSKQSFLNVLIESQKKTISSKIQDYYKDDPEAQEIISFLKSNPVEMIPYWYQKKYRDMNIEVKLDSTNNLYVVKVNGNDIYFPKEMTKEYVIESVRVALIEQDEKSPHKYLPVTSLSIQGDVAVLCGASDGIYALQIINSFRKIYLFEANPAWVKPIKKTLHHYLDKIEIVPYFVSNEDGSNTLTLDSFFANRNEEVNYIQADIEDAELKMLQGATQLLRRSANLKLALCCYHTENQQKELTAYLTGKGFTVRTSAGFLLMWMQYPLRAPYLRRGVLYATR
jgi:hypothetical protein